MSPIHAKTCNFNSLSNYYWARHWRRLSITSILLTNVPSQARAISARHPIEVLNRSASEVLVNAWVKYGQKSSKSSENLFFIAVERAAITYKVSESTSFYNFIWFTIKLYISLAYASHPLMLVKSTWSEIKDACMEARMPCYIVTFLESLMLYEFFNWLIVTGRYSYAIYLLGHFDSNVMIPVNEQSIRDMSLL